MKTIFHIAPVACGVLALILTGCTQMSVQKVERGRVAKGIVYSLPKPMLKVNPLPNGTMQAEFVFIPDPENTYAIDTDSYFASHVFKADVNSNGFLTQVIWSPDSAQVLKDAIDKAATTAVSTAKLYEDARKDDETEKETKRTNCEKAEEVVKTLEGEVRTKLRDKEKADENLARDERRLKEYTGTNTTEIAKLEDVVLSSKQKADDAGFALNEAKVKLADGEAKRDKACKGTVRKDKSDDVVVAKETGKSDGGLQNNPVNARIASRQIVPQQMPRLIFASASLAAADPPKSGAKPPIVPKAPGTSDTNPSAKTDPKAETKDAGQPDGKADDAPNLPLVYAPLLFSIQEGRTVASSNELREGRGRFDVRLTPVLAGTNPEPGKQDTFRTAKPYKAPPAPAEKVSWTILGDPLTSLENQGDVVQARQARDEVKRALDAEQSEPKKNALRLDYEKAAAKYDDLVRILGSRPLICQLAASKAVKGLELVKGSIAVKKKNDDTTVAFFRTVKRKSDTEWEVRLSASIPPDDYYLYLEYKIGEKDQDPVIGNADFTVQ